MPARFFTDARVVIVAGKGGVGKTTVTAALASAAAHAGLSTLIVEVEGKSGLGAVFGRDAPLTYEEVTLSGNEGANGSPALEATRGTIRARTLTPDDALVEYLDDHGLSRVSRRLAESGTLEIVSTAAPGIKDILILGKIKQLERLDPADLILLDAPAAGHAISFLRSAGALLDAVPVGPIGHQAREVMELLTDSERCQVLLVTIPEETPVNEVIETAFSLEDHVGIKLGPVVVNGLYPDLHGLDTDPHEAAERAGTVMRPGEVELLRSAARFRRRRADLQRDQVARLRRELPLPQLHLPFLFDAEVGPEELDNLAGAVTAGLVEIAMELHDAPSAAPNATE